MTDYNVALGSQYTLKLRVTLASQNIAANTSVVNFYLYAIKNSGSGYYTYTAKPYNWNINGNSGSGAKTYDFRSYTTLLLVSGSYTIPHNADGTKSISVSGYFNPDSGSTALAAATASGTYALPTIPRASTPTVSPTSFDAGTTVTVNMNRASTSFTHTVTYDFGALADQSIATGVGASTTWVPPMSLLNQIPTAVSGSGVIRVVTYSGATYIGTKTVGFTLTAPATVVPTISSLTKTEATTTPDVAALIGSYVQSVSALNLAIVGASGAYGSTVVSHKLTVAGQTINAASGVTTPIAISGTVPISAEVTDSRGRKSSFPVTNITVLSYIAPTASPVEASRAVSGGAINETEGTYIRVDMTAVVQSLINGTQKNLLQYRVSTSPYEANTWTVRVPTTSVGASTLAFNSFSTPFPYVLLDAGPPNYFPINAPFDIKVEIIDKLNTSVIIRSVAQGEVLIDQNGNSGVGFGGYHQGLGKVEVWGGDIYQQGNKVMDVTTPVLNTQLPARVQEVASYGSGNANTFVTNGWYRGSGVANAPTTDWCYFEVIAHSATYVYQRAIAYFTNDIYTRWMRNGVWTAWVKVALKEDLALLRGTAAQRAATTSAYWQFWQDTDGAAGLYVGNKTGGWRKYSGQESFGSAAWATIRTSGEVILSGRTISATLDTILESNEVIMMAATGVGTGYGLVTPNTLSRNATNTVVSFRFMQLMSTTTQGVSVAWNVLQT